MQAILHDSDSNIHLPSRLNSQQTPHAPNLPISSIPSDSQSIPIFNEMSISASAYQRSPSPSSHMSIQSLLTASKQPTQQQSHLHTWSTSDLSMQSLSVAKPSSKRKLDDIEPEGTEKRARRIEQKSVSLNTSQMIEMTTVICLHAAVAQKSYGSEKRFLCPPPLVRMEGSFTNFREQQLSMSIVSENGERSPEQKAPLDAHMMASFKYLHVTGTAKAKSFQLSLQVSQPTSPNLTSEGASQRPARTWATFESAPVTIISKPSKKTAKTRNMSSCILAGGPVSLFNRINSQTVRTKYMTIDRSQLCASNTSWSAFNVNVINRPTDTNAMALTGPQPVTYGCEVVLQDTLSLVATAPLIIRKVDKGKISDEEGGPISQMQKIALQRINPDGSRHYLSAAGPLPGAPGVTASPIPSVASQTGTHHLLFSSPRIRDEMKDGIRLVTDEVDDYLCWTIVGISKFQYTFFDASGANDHVPEIPITPFPTLFTIPNYTSSNNSMDMTVSNYFYDDSKTGQSTPLEVWIGHFGPLPQHVYPPTTTGPLINIASYPTTSVNASIVAQHRSSEIQQLGELSSSPSAGEFINDNLSPRYPASPVHTHVVVTLPPVADIIKELRSDLIYSIHEGTPDLSRAKTEDEAASSSTASVPQTFLQQIGSNTLTHTESRGVSLAGRSLPILFVRGVDKVGYHSGRTVTCENVFDTLELNLSPAVTPNRNNLDADTDWLAAAQRDGGMHGWTLRIL